MSSSDSLIILGGGFEALGVVAVAVDLWITRRKVRGYEQRSRTIYLTGIAEGSSVGKATITGGLEPTLNERVEALENRVSQAEQELRGPEKQQQLRTAMEQIAERAQQAIRDDVEALDTLLKGLTVGGIGLRVMGAVLVVIGIGLSGWGSLIR